VGIIAGAAALNRAINTNIAGLLEPRHPHLVAWLLLEYRGKIDRKERIARVTALLLMCSNKPPHKGRKQR
jgi:hypothetical protein